MVDILGKVTILFYQEKLGMQKVNLRWLKVEHLMRKGVRLRQLLIIHAEGYTTTAEVIFSCRGLSN